MSRNTLDPGRTGGAARRSDHPLAWGVVALFCVAAAALVAAGAQQSIRVDLVTLNVLVTDRDGRYVSGLTQDDFVVLEDAEPQQLERFAATDHPLSLIVLLDASASMEARLPVVRQSVRRLLDALGPNDRTQLVQFNNRISVLEKFTTDRKAIEAGLDRLDAGGNTAVLNAVYRAFRETAVALAAEANRARRWAIVLLSDGVDTASLFTVEQVLDEARRSAAVVYVVSLLRDMENSAVLGAQYEQAARLFRGLAGETGGRLVRPLTAEDLTEAFSEVASALRTQYTIGYVSTNAISDGRWRTIAVTVKGRPDLRLRHREGYFADVD